MTNLSSHQTNTSLGYMQVILAALLWGTYGLFVRALDYSPEFIMFFRFFFGFLGLLAFTAARRDYSWVKPVKDNWKLLIIPSVLSCVSWLCYTYAINLTSVANAAFLIYTAPVFVVIFTPLLLREKLELTTIVALFISLLGTAALVGYSGLIGNVSSIRGDLIALFGGMTYGLFVIYLKKMPLGVLGLPSSIMVAAIVALGMLPFALTQLGLLKLEGFLILLALGLVQQTLGTTLYHFGLNKIKAQHAGILSYLEPLSATLLAILFLAEGFTLGTVTGGLLIVGGGIIIVTRGGSQN